MKTIRIRITDAAVVLGAHAEVGSVHELPASDALLILGAGRAVRHSAPVEIAAVMPVVERAVIARAPRNYSRRPSPV